MCFKPAQNVLLVTVLCLGSRGPLLRRVVDFGAGWFDLGYAFGMQKAMNAPGKSPAMCSEF